MSLPPIIYPAKRRVHHKRRSVSAAPAPVGHLNVTDVEAVFENDELFVRVWFDTTEENPLGDISAADALKWTARFDGVRYFGLYLVPDAFNKLTVYYGPDLSDEGADEISYTNAPSDISDSIGRALAAFTRPLS